MSIESYQAKIIQVLSLSVNTVFVFPLLFIIPAFFELIQHIAELQMGMFNSRTAFDELSSNNIRLYFGVLKAISIIVISMIIIPRTVLREYYFTHTDALNKVATKETWKLLVSTFTLLAIGSLFAYTLNFTVLDSLESPQRLKMLKLAVIGPLLIGSIIFEKNQILSFSRIYSDHRSSQFKADLKRSRNFSLNQLYLALPLCLPLMYIHVKLNQFAIGEKFILQLAILGFDSFVIGAIATVLGVAVTLSFCYTTKIQVRTVFSR